MRRTIYDDVHEDFRASFRRFVDKEIVPHHERWENEGRVDKAMFREAGRLGFLGMAVPEEYGGPGVDDFRFNAIMSEELQRLGVLGSGICLTLHNDIVLPYLLGAANEEQKARWLPRMVTGELMGAISMTEPGAGSDLASIRATARREGDDYVINGAKTFVTNGLNADLVVLAAKTDPGARHAGISLIVVEDGTPGFERGKKIDKIGQRSQDTAELFFSDARVPVANRLGDEGQGFRLLMTNLAQERLSMAVVAVAGARQALRWTIEYCQTRQAFGGPLTDQQFVKFELADLTTVTEIAQIYVDRMVEDHVAGRARAEDAAKAKYWTSEMQRDLLDRCLQLHGGYGYTREYPIARAYLDGRVQTIYGGTTQIMKEIIGRSVAAGPIAEDTR